MPVDPARNPRVERPAAELNGRRGCPSGVYHPSQFEANDDGGGDEPWTFLPSLYDSALQSCFLSGLTPVPEPGSPGGAAPTQLSTPFTLLEAKLVPYATVRPQESFLGRCLATDATGLTHNIEIRSGEGEVICDMSGYEARVVQADSVDRAAWTIKHRQENASLYIYPSPVTGEAQLSDPAAGVGWSTPLAEPPAEAPRRVAGAPPRVQTPSGPKAKEPRSRLTPEERQTVRSKVAEWSTYIMRA